MTDNRRTQAEKLADALNTIEGAPITAYAKELSQRWVDGEITGEEMKEALLQYHRNLASLDAQHYPAADKDNDKF